MQTLNAIAIATDAAAILVCTKVRRRLTPEASPKTIREGGGYGHNAANAQDADAGTTCDTGYTPVTKYIAGQIDNGNGFHEIVGFYVPNFTRHAETITTWEPKAQRLQRLHQGF